MIWLAIALCLVVSFVFSGVEAGILSVNRVRLKHRVKLRDRAAIKLNRLLSNPERLLVTVLVVTNLMNVFAITLATQELVARFGGYGYVMAVVAFLPIYLLGLELLPKSLFRRFPYRAMAALAEPLRIADKLLTPLHWIGATVEKAVARQQPVEHQKLFFAREEFKYLTIESERTGTLTSTERQMIHNVVDFRAVTAREVMLPIADVQTISGTASLEQLLVRSNETKIERWPVLAANGEMTGLINVFDIALDGRRRGSVAALQRRIMKVAPNEPAYSVLRKMRAARSTVAAVLDPGARPLGIVTWEGLIKRLVSTAVV